MKKIVQTFILVTLFTVAAQAETAIEAGEMAHVVSGRDYGAESIGAVALVLSCGATSCEVTYNYIPGADGRSQAKPEHRKTTIERRNLLRAVPLSAIAETAMLVREAIRDGRYNRLSPELKQSWHYSDNMIEWIREKYSRNKRGQDALTYNCRDYGWAPTDACRLKIAQSYVSLVHKNMHCVSNYRSWGIYVTTLVETPTKDRAGLFMYQQQSAGRYDMNPLETEKIIQLSGDSEISTNNAAIRAFEQGSCEHLD